MDDLTSSFERSEANIFQQDGAPAYTGKIVKEWLAIMNDLIKDWAGNSQDISEKRTYGH